MHTNPFFLWPERDLPLLRPWLREVQASPSAFDMRPDRTLWQFGVSLRFQPEESNSQAH